MPDLMIFTIEQLDALISKSSAFRTLSEKERKKIIELSRDVSSEKTQKLYQALLRERQGYIEIEKEYIRKTGKIMTDLDFEVSNLKHKALNKERISAEEKAQEQEQEAANQIIKSI